jgi:uncharacterized protein (DUF885 family)
VTAVHESNEPLAALSDELFDTTMTASPFWASAFGVMGYDHLLPDLSEEAEAAVSARLGDIAGRAAQLSPQELSSVERVTRAVLLHEATRVQTELDDDHTGMTVGGYLAPFLNAIRAMAKQPGGPDLVARLEGVPTYLEQAAGRAMASAAAGRSTNARGVAQALEQIDGYLALGLDNDPLLVPARGTALEEKVRGLVADRIRPSVQRYRETVAGPIAAAARPDDRAGLVHVPDGDQIYARALANHTTTTHSPEEIHQLGLDLCDALRDEYAELGDKVFGISDFAAVTDRLRNDLDLRYSTPDEIVTEARQALVRAEEAMPAFFGTRPVARCEVNAIADVEAPTAPLAYYMPPASDGSRPGQHWINTFEPHTRTRYEYEALAFHESVPGHHLQLTISQELGDEIPPFRRSSYVAAFSEGWGLYTERLADEMGLYSGDLARFGMPSFDSWRACRLVVDTGLHHRGWSRDQAIDFMWDNSTLTRANIINEVDRYIAWPGQACAYMIGRLEIQDLRREAQQALGSGFGIKQFHDAVLLHGGVPLTVLRDEVTSWIKSGRGPTDLG